MDAKFLSNRFKKFATRECRGSSRLYEFLSTKISGDYDLLELSSYSSLGQPIPNLLFASVHYLLLSGADHGLKYFYPSITNEPRPVEESFSFFEDFCREYRNEIITILQNKFVQTNEIRRCTYLFPSFCFIHNKVKKPLFLVEIGTSAGLQLLWDKYSYSYGINGQFGDPDSNIHLSSELRNGNFPGVLLQKIPPIASRIGIDLHVVDVSQREGCLWLKSLIWPEHKDRLRLFEKAVQLYIAHPADLIEGDGVSLVLDVACQTPLDSVLCVFHTHVANQFSDSLKNKLIENIKTIGAKREVFHLYNNVFDIGKLHLDYFIKGMEINQVIGETDGHGRWFDWKLRDIDR